MTHINDDAPTSNPYQAPRTSETIDTPAAVDPNRFALPKRSMTFYFVSMFAPLLIELVSKRYRIATTALVRYTLGIVALAMVFLAVQGVLAAVLKGETSQKLSRRVAGRCFLFVGAIGMAFSAALLMDELQFLFYGW